MAGPDGGRTIHHVDAPPNGLYVIRSNGENLTPLVTTKDWKRGPDWTAD
jgi:hypothetical protein